MEPGYAVIQLDDVPASEHFGGQHFKPVRMLLGIEAFGVAAWLADAGEVVVGEHTEPPDGQEELYVVLAGRAAFTIGTAQVTAPAGACVAVRAGVRRRADAEMDGTAVLAVGALRGKAYDAPDWERAAAAAPAYRAGDYASAAATLRAALEEHSDSVGVLYNLACCEALIGHRDDALAHLQRALRIQPDLAAHARADTDLDSIRDDPRFAAAVAN